MALECAQLVPGQAALRDGLTQQASRASACVVGAESADSMRAW